MMNVQVTGIEWDKGNQEKCQKHGVTREEIEVILMQKHSYLAPDEQHSEHELRYLAIGRSPLNDRPLFIVFTIREHSNGLWLRPISARYMHKKEAKEYEKESTSI